MDHTQQKSNFYKKLFPLNNRIALTSGDPDGVGFFITKQALKSLGIKKQFQFLVWSTKEAATLKIPPFKTRVFSNESLAFNSPFSAQHLIQIKSSQDVGAWIKQACKRALKKELSALVTGPVSKLSLKKYKAVGQTDLLKKLTNSPNVFMGFRGQLFNVILLSDHIPFTRLSLQKKQLKTCLDLALSAREFLPKALQKKPLGLLALNPHAGEHGLLGQEEKQLLAPLVKTYGRQVKGPLVPDAAFLKKEWKNYSFYVCLYHDQGLIPFKMIHEQKGFAQSIGLPFLRLGVDHGTGLGLKKKEISSESFLLAVKEALRYISNNKKSTS